MNMYLSIWLLALVTVILVNSSPIDFEQHESWKQFKLEHGKVYADNKTEFLRFNIFLENEQKILKHNEMANAGLKSYSLAMNKYGDLSAKEFVQMKNGYKGSTKRMIGKTFDWRTNFQLPESVDWRVEGYVTPVKDQGHCGSCWAFSATGSLEGQHFRKTGKLVSLSEQNLVDCSSSYGNAGCNGGLMNIAFKYIEKNGGIDTENSYPYEAENDECRFKKTAVGATVKGFANIRSGKENELAAAVAKIGPVSVAIDASHSSFQFYSYGVYDEHACSSTELDHGVLAVGFGVSSTGKKYWIIKNSWGPKWGVDGYLYLERGVNRCGLATSASFPLV